MQLSITELAGTWKVSKAKIYRDIQSGKLSRLPNGMIDISEVLRVYGEADTQNRKEKKVYFSRSENRKTETDEKERMLLERIKSLEAQVQESKERETWLRTKLDEKDEQLRLLEYKPAVQQQAASKPKRGLFARVLGAISDD